MITILANPPIALVWFVVCDCDLFWSSFLHGGQRFHTMSDYLSVKGNGVFVDGEM